MKQLRQFLMLLTTLLVSQSAMAEYYGIQVGGVKVTSENCTNITGEHIKPWLDGYISTCSYNPETKTLTLGNISIVRSGSGNRAILNESCDGLTIRFVNPCQLSATNASPLRLNANTTITSIPMDITNVSGYWGFSIYIEGDYEDAITIGNGARFEIKDCTNMKIEADRSSGIVGNTGAEMLTIINSDIKIYRPETYTAQPTWAGIKNLLSVFAENSTVYIDYSHQAVFNVFNFYLSSDMVAKADQWINIAITATFDSTMKTFYYMDGDRAREIYELLLVPSVPIDEEHFPDENFRAYIKEAKDTWPTDGKLDQQEAALYTDISGNKSYYIAIDAPERGISSLKGLEYFPKLELLNVGENNLTELDLTPCPQLKTVYCHRNQLTSLNMANNKSLETLWCYNNQLTSLNLTNCNYLRSLICENNNITGLDFSHCSSLRGVYIGGNRIDSWMTETLESLPTIPEEEFAQIHITALSPVNSENTCTQAQADIARQKGWDVILDNIDGDGNMYYSIQIAGQAITSANKDDLTVLPYITKNHSSGYAYYDSNKNELHLSGVDIVLPDSIQSDAINVSTKKDFTIQLGWKPVNIVTNHTSSEGILFEETDYTFNITSEDGETTSELNVTTQDNSIHTYSSLVIGGYAKVTLASKRRIALYCTTCDLTMKEHAELMLVHSIMPLRMTGDSTFGDVNLEDGIGIVSPVGARYDKSQGIIVDKDGNKVTGEVLFGQPKNYDLYIAGTRVNTSNLSDVLGDGGSVCFNGIDKLTLKNANIDGGTSQYGIDARFPINILLEGENNVNGYWGIVLTGESHIKGPGSLNVSGSRGIVFNSPVIFIENSAQVSVEGTGRHAIAKGNSSSEEVVIRGSETFVRLKGVYGAVDIKRLTLEDNLQMALPKGAYFKNEWDGIVRASGSPIKNEWVTIANQDFVDANNKDADGNIIYNIAFAGDTITSAIAADLTVLPAISLNTEGGYARYDATNNSLHLSGVDIEVDADTKAHALDISTFRDATIVLGGDPVCIYSNYYDQYDQTYGIQGLHRSGNVQSHLTITTEEGAETDGNFFISTQGYGVVAECGVTIAGKAKVRIESTRKTAFELKEATGSNLTLKEDAGLTLTAPQEPLFMTIYCQLVMEDYIGILQPFGATYSEDMGCIVDAEGKRLRNTTIIIDKRQGYGIYVAGIEVNNINQTDVLGDGTVNYDSKTGVLSLTNVDIDGGTDNYGIFAYVPFIMTLTGENTVKGTHGLYLTDQTTVNGTGSLYCVGDMGIYSSGPGITIEGGIHVKAEGTTAFGMGKKNTSAGGITVRGKETIVEMRGTQGTYDFNDLTLEDDLIIGIPQGAYFKYGSIVDADGSPVKGQWVIIAQQDYITGAEHIPGLVLKEENIYNVAGQRVSKDYKGIIISNGKKLIK
ncbi:MAG: hypothetical protein IIV20_05860 [Bacteroidaceae bacterium]|nr:hypothetical protein [Bacteroidaceae bacterium]